MTKSLVEQVDDGDFDRLFRLDLFWGAPDQKPIELALDDGLRVTATNVSSFKGVRVWEIPALPGSSVEAALDRILAKQSTNRLVIFHDGKQQVWRWPSRSTKGGGVISRPARHVHRVGDPDPRFELKLEAIRLPSDTVVDVNELLARVRGAFDVETKNETKRASKLMARMYAAVEKGYTPDVDSSRRDHEISVTLARILFLLFGDDTEMWKAPSGEALPDLFQDFVKDGTEQDGSDIADRLNDLFDALDTSAVDRDGLGAELTIFPYVNGGIFEEKITLPLLDADFREAILSASAVDWSTISPAIFGSMFQSVRDAQTRRELGEHYTSEENILKTLNPLFLDELREEFDAAMERETPQKRINALNGLWKKLGDLRYMDPACGCGNFIIVAYRELRDLELRIMDALATLQQGEAAVALDTDWTHLLKVTLDHFSGIEIDEWPARIAETAMFLIDRQCDLKMKERFGVAPERLPIQRASRIVVGNALQVPWADVCTPSRDVVVAGNPPFLGDHTRTTEQKAELQAAWGDDTTLSRLDYVTGWYAKALDYFARVDGRWAFVSTNSICQGDPVARLFGPIFDQRWRIRFAHRTFAWTSEATGAAAVHCVIVGFDRAAAPSPRIFEYAHFKADPSEVPDVRHINAYLADGPNVLVTKRTSPLCADLTMPGYGSKPSDGGFLTVTADEIDDVRADPIASQYLRRYIGTDELLYGTDRWCLWLLGAPQKDLKASAILRKRIDGVRESRLRSKAPQTRAKASTPHLFGQRAPIPEVAVLAIPEVSSENRPYLPVAHLDPGTIVSNKVYSTPDPSGFLFAIASSAMLITWQRTVGGRLESRLSFSNTIVWNNFPLPPVNAPSRRAIIEAGSRVLTVREELGAACLAELYPGPTLDPRLQVAHDQLDEAVDAAFGLRPSSRVTELGRQHALFESYDRLSSGLLGTPARRVRQRREL